MKIFKITFIAVSVFFCACNMQDQGLPDGHVLLMDFNTDKHILVNDNESQDLSFVEGIDNLSLDLGDYSFNAAFPDSAYQMFSNSRDFTIGIWVKSKVLSSDTTIIFSNSSFSKNKTGYYGPRRINNGFTLYNCNGSWGWNIGNGSQNFLYEPIADDQPLNDNEWHYLCFSHKAKLKELRLYYDGINRAVLHIGDLAHNDFISNLPLCVGSDKNNNPDYDTFDGAVDELSVWSKVLSSKEIKDLYGKYKGVVKEPVNSNGDITVVNWNIWHGATHYTKEKDGFDGVARTIELIRDADADIVLMQETYGAGSKISSNLGYYYYEAGSCIGAVWGANLSVMSRYPIEEAYLLEEKSNYGRNYAFNNAGVKVRLNNDKQVIAFTNWYNGQKPEDLDGALKGWSSLIENADSIPVIFGGDYNSTSHLDDGKGESGHSRLMTNAGFVDSYRTFYPNVKSHPGYSFNTSKARIDYIYFKGNSVDLIDVKPIVPNFKGKGKLTPEYPSDHLGIVSKFKVK